MTMARLIAALLLVLVAAEDTSSPSCTQAGHSLMQSKRQLTSAKPAESPPKKATVDMVADEADADAMDNSETKSTAAEAKAGDTSAPKKTSSGRNNEQETNHADDANAAAKDKKETNKEEKTNANSTAAEAKAGDTSAPKKASSGRKNEQETNHADDANAVAKDKKEIDKEEKDNASHTSAASKKEVKHSGLSFFASSPRWSKGDFCRSHPCSVLLAGDKRRGLGGTATLDEAGYVAVAELKDDEEMKKFIQRVIEGFDCKVEHDGGLMGMVPWFSGTTAVQSFEKLTESLLFAVLANGERWISYKNTARITGTDVPLDLRGYVDVAIIRSGSEMQTFARRLAEQMGIEITDNNGFAGMMNYYDGAATFQSFDKLQEDIRSAAASPNTWAKFKSM